MNNFLDRVIASKKAEIAFKRSRVPERELALRAADVAVRGFRDSIVRGSRIIAEIKKKSPSTPAFPHASDPARLAAIYREKGAAAISIVTDAENFGTSLQDVGPVREAAGLPVLVKEFVLDPYQVLEARAAGADALLLIARLLPVGELMRFLDLVRELGMDALVECHDEDDVARAIEAGADIFGVNNRNLATLAVTLEATRRLLPLIPEEALAVSESGIDTSTQIEELSSLGADAFLIGTSILKAPEPGSKLEELAAHQQARSGRQARNGGAS